MQTKLTRDTIISQGFSTKMLKRFWDKINKTDKCWLWTGACDDFGYGMMTDNCIKFSTHRVSWMIHNSPIASSICVLHICDIPPCVRPDHLFLGTRTDNSEDKMRKGRHNCFRVLNQAQVEQILQLGGTKPQYEIAKICGVNEGNVSSVLAGHAWRHILPHIKRDFKPIMPCGEHHPNSKFTNQDILRIRSLYESGHTMESIAKMYQRSQHAIRCIIRRITWWRVA